MNEYISKLIDEKEMIGGKISFDEEGFVIFKRLTKEELETLPEEQRAYATTAMGRAIFRLGEDGKIINYKGVDSHLDNSEMGMINNVGVLAINYSKPDEDFINSTYPVVLTIFLGQGADIRIRGASPLEDLEIEADINYRMQDKGIKLPIIKQVKEFSVDFLDKYGLPSYVNGSFTEFDSDYEEEDIARKAHLKEVMGDNYHEQEVSGKRPQTVAEFFRQIGIADDPRIQDFFENSNYDPNIQKITGKREITLEDFSEYVDKEYSRGQRYGQAIRELECPFRVADFEILNGDSKNLPKIEAIAGFIESMHPDRVPFEQYFAMQMGKNLGNMMNNGWECENFSHRQDYSLTGEMCDDSYVYIPDKLENLNLKRKQGEQLLSIASNSDDIEKTNQLIGSAKASRTEIRLKYFTQIYLLSSNIKILQDEMAIRGKSKEEIDSVLTTFLDSFAQTVDLEKASEYVSFGTEKFDADIAKKCIELLARVPKNMAKLLAFQPKGHDKPSINKEVLKTQTPYNAFFDEVSSGLAERFNFQRTFINETLQDVKGVNPYDDFNFSDDR